MIRWIGADASCLICTILTAISADATCPTVIFDFLNSLMNLVDGIANATLTALITIVLDVVFAIIDLFSGTPLFQPLHVSSYPPVTLFVR